VLPVAATITLNTLLLYLSIRFEKNGAAFATEVALGPVGNAILILVFLALIPIVRRIAGGTQVWPYVLVVCLLPIAGYLIDWACISYLDLNVA
jgi:hypothetical protein